jgi:hypothetical protein
MVRKSHFDPQRVREEIAIAAARMIAQDGLDYATAKRKAARRFPERDGRAASGQKSRPRRTSL